MPIKAIIFDCFGVLTTDLWREFCASLPEGPGLTRAHELNHAYDAGQITLEEFLDGVEQATGRRPEEIEKLLDNEVNKNTQLLDYIADLKSHYKIGLLSNVATNWISDSFLTPREQQLFDAMVFSYEAGMTKPDPRIFELICQRLGVEPGETIMVDDIDRYCAAARDSGLQAIQYINFAQLKRELESMLSAGQL